MMNDYERGRSSSGHGNTRGSRSSSRSSSSYNRNGHASGSGRTGSSSHSAGSRGRSTRSGSSSSHRPSQNRSPYHSGSGYGRRRNHRRKNSFNSWTYGVVGLVAVVAVVSVIFAFRGKQIEETETESIEETTLIPETELEKTVMVDNIVITGMSRDVAKAAILKEYPWAMTVQNEDETYQVKNLMETKVDALLDEIFTGEPKENYTLDTHGLEEAAAAEAKAVAELWDKKAKNGSISSFDEDANKFVFTGAELGIAIDQEKLTADILSALDKKQFDQVIFVTANEVHPEFDEETAKEKYKTVSTFTTNSTANSKRNTNLKLACRAINGTVLQPGEEFSFNTVVGQRTEEKGYQPAGAYSNGEVVQEIGGGVCQVSTTLYNAVLRAGLKTTTRRSHTYEPSYVTPGMDATVSYGGPDYKFVNNSSTAIGIRASYSDQVVTVSIYAVPILEEGVKYTLKSTKLKDTDVPPPTYEEDLTLLPDVEKVKSEGSQGSYWETRLVITKDGETISDDVDHNTTYKGHAPVILRNTSGVVIAPENTEAVPTETPIASEGAADGFANTAPIDVPEPGAAANPTGSTTSSGNTNKNESSSETASRPTEPLKPAEPSRPAESTTPAPTAPSAPAPTQGTTPGTANPGQNGPGFSGPGNGNPAEIVAPNPLGA